MLSVDEDGYYTFIGRLDDMITIEGEKICALTVEQMIEQAAADMVSQVCIVGLYNEEVATSELAACIVPKYAITDKQQFLQQLQSKIAEGISVVYSRPKRLVLVEQMPMLKAGKVNKAAVQALVANFTPWW